MLTEEQKKSIASIAKVDCKDKPIYWLEDKIETSNDTVVTFTGKLALAKLLKKKYTKGFQYCNPAFDFMNDSDYITLMQKQFIIKTENEMEDCNVQIEGAKIQLKQFKNALAKARRKRSK